ncbi:hypothetical protein CS063_01845 [Sporanaerobium hydrogeniformans]|uniref:Uncharacterized protein n=1 Tax=Sporanaerobium hydrogeniformans TaxID=3072179 RepID=A0AC61DKR1_9FIRM|nr:glycerophosphodiester phosphodiesterase [Sporanaerobium hydrogeniformans]PHV72242.1 hypothetical protein CS063_01845 [Sporanaerobium hydrogeniformans]
MKRKKYTVLAISFMSFCLLIGRAWAADEAKLIAHRGGCTAGRENTLEALRHAMEQPICAIEVDVQLTKDGQVILCHDENLKGKEREEAPIYSLTYEEVLARDEKIPTLREALRLTKGKISLLIELKSYALQEELVNAVIKELKNQRAINEVELCCFDRELLVRLREKEPTLRLGLLTASYEIAKAEQDFEFLSIHYKVVTQELINQLHAKGKKVYVWTVNRKEEAQWLNQMGVNRIITDRPLELEVL